MTNNKVFIRNAISVAVMSLVGAGNAHAAIEEVVVTAQKRAESVNDIGVSASAFSGDGLEDLGVGKATDLGAHTPGLVTVNSTSGGTTIFAIRGIGLDDFSPNNTSGVGVYLDEVFASNPVFASGQLFDVERVEVLKGPQGTLYGKNTTGGAINFISKKPTDEFEAYIDMSYGRFNTIDTTAAISGALSDSVRGRLSANYVDSDGWQEDINTGKEYGEQDKFAVRGLLDFDISDLTSATLKTYYSSDESTPESPQVDGLVEAFGDPSFGVLNSPSDADDVTVGGLDVGRDEDGYGVSLTLTHSFDGMDLISISSYDSYEREVVDNYGGSSAAILDLYQENEMTQWGQELRLVSTTDGDTSWVAGVNISKEKVEVMDRFDDSFFVTDSVAVTGVLDPADVSAQGLDLLTADYEQETDSYGLYVHTETALSDQWNLIIGARYSYDDRSFDGVSTNHDAGFSFNDEIARLDESESESAVTGKTGLELDVTEDIMLYGSVSNSYKSGAFYGAAILDDISWAYVDPEEVLAYELGFKAMLLDSTLQINGAVFALEYTDRQSLVTIIVDDFSNFVGAPVADTTLINVPESETKGFELDVSWEPAEGFLVNAGVAYLDTEVTKAPTTADMRGINADASVNDGGAPYVDALAAPLEEGEALAQSPERRYNGLVAYEHYVADNMMLRLQTSYSRADAMVAQLADANAESDAVSSWDAQVSLTDEASGWKVAAWIKNIEDNDAETYSFSSFAGRSYYRQQPTTFGVSVRMDFE